MTTVAKNPRAITLCEYSIMLPPTVCGRFQVNVFVLPLKVMESGILTSPLSSLRKFSREEKLFINNTTAKGILPCVGNVQHAVLFVLVAFVDGRHDGRGGRNSVFAKQEKSLFA